MYALLLLVPLLLLLLTAIIRQRQLEAEEKSYYEAAKRVVQEEYLNDSIKNPYHETGAVKTHGPKRMMVFLKPPHPVKSKGYVFDPKEGITFGRGQDNQICIKEKTVSTDHCQIILHEGNVFLQDRNSSNGTYIKRGMQTIQIDSGASVSLQSGDQIKIGSSSFKLRLFYYDMEQM
jgi:hypothetical protein